MYFSNINDSEVQKFHGITAPNFTIKLTDILTSPLFHVETIVTDSIYKIYPLFNTNEIISSNPQDKVLENKCVICKKLDTPTRISFISDETQEVEDYIAYGSYFDIGDTLTMGEFNSIVQLIRNNSVLKGIIKVKDGEITGDYGKYLFNIPNATIIDNGILITDETLTNIGTVTLKEPAFSNATYKLTLTVTSFENANIMLDEPVSEPITSTITIELIEDTAVTIPFEVEDKYCIVSFDALVQVKYDKPVINGAYVTDLDLTANPPVIQIGDTSILNILATDLGHIGVSGKNIKLYKGTTLLDTLTTDNNGEASYTYTGVGDGLLSFTAKYGGEVTTEVLDCLFYDNCTSADHNDSIWSENPSLDFNRTTEYTELSLQQDTTSGITYMTGLSPYYVIDFDYYQVDGSIGNGFVNIYSNSASLTWFSLGNIGLSSHLGQWVSLRLELTSTSATLTYRDDPTKTLTKTYDTTTPTKLRFIVSSTGITKMRLKNIRVYPSNTLFEDTGTDVAFNTNWTNYNDYITIGTRDANGTPLSNTSGNVGYYTALNPAPSDDFAIEFDLVNRTGQVYISYKAQTDRIRLDTRTNDGDHIKIEHRNGENNIYVNDTFVTTVTTDDLDYVSFSLNNNATLKYKDFKIYKI